MLSSPISSVGENKGPERPARIRPRGGLRLLLLAGGLAGGLRPLPAEPLEKASMFINWRAEPEWGGFFQALEAGIYRKYGLDAEIRLGNPQSNSAVMLTMHKVDFTGGSGGNALNFLAHGLPLVTVAAIFQKDPRILIAHPGQGNDTLEEMKGKPILVGAPGLTTFWPFLRQRYGFTDDQIRPYTFNEAAFLTNPKAIQQGYITDEPFMLAREGVPHPVVILLADHGYEEYVTTLVTTRELVRTRPDFVRRFVRASLEGWQSYLFGDPSPGNAFIKRNNPDMPEAQMLYAIRVIRERGMVDSGDAKRLGIGAMTDERWAKFYQSIVGYGLLPRGLDVKQAYTLQFLPTPTGP